LIEALAGEDFTTAPTFDAIKALPALLVEPANQWLDGTSESGPGRVVRYDVECRVVVNNPEPIGGLADLEDHVELVLGRLPRSWRFTRAEAPVRVQASGGELVALSSLLILSMRYSIT
jgi:hypothetical protein